MSLDKKSGAYYIHQTILNIPIGTVKSHKSIRREVTLNHPHAAAYSEGVYNGFYARAIERGVLERIRGRDTFTKTNATYYKILSHAEWTYKAPGIGSLPGRTMNTIKRNQLSLALATDTDDGILDKIREIVGTKDKTLSEFTNEELLEELAKRLS